jgi:hypothetical protein
LRESFIAFGCSGSINATSVKRQQHADHFSRFQIGKISAKMKAIEKQTKFFLPIFILLTDLPKFVLRKKRCKIRISSAKIA